MTARGPSRLGGKEPAEPAPQEEDESSDFADTVLSPGSLLDDMLAGSSGNAIPSSNPDLEATILGVGGRVALPSPPEPPAPPARKPVPPGGKTQPRPAAQRPPAAQAPEPPPTRAPSRAQTRPAPPIGSGDQAPAFRSDLEMQRTNHGFVVRDPASGSSLELNQYEVSIARMLDGKRSITQVLENSGRLGIPVNLESLQMFILRLEEHGLLASASTTDAAAKAWPKRGQWETSVRGLFQSGIRLLRTGKHAEACGYFEAVLAQDPENEEARELLAMAKASPAENVPFEMAPTAPSPTVPPPMMPAGHSAVTTQPGLGTNPIAPAMPDPYQQPYPSQSYPAQPYPSQMMMPPPVMTMGYPQLQASQRPAVVPPYPSRTSTRRLLLIGVIALVVIAIATYLVLRQLRPAATATATTPAPTAQPVATTQPVKPPPPDPAKPAPTKPDPAKAGVAAAGSAGSAAAVAPAGSAAGSNAGSAETGSAGSASSAADGSAAPAEHPPAAVAIKAPLTGEIAHAYLDKPRDVHKGDNLFEIVHVTSDPARQRALEAKIAQLEPIANKDTGGAFVPQSVIDASNELARARSELANLGKVQRVVVKATQDGHAEPKVSHGTTVKAGSVLAEITP